MRWEGPVAHRFRSGDDDPQARRTKVLGQLKSLGPRVLFGRDRSCHTINVDGTDKVNHRQPPMRLVVHIVWGHQLFRLSKIEHFEKTTLPLYPDALQPRRAEHSGARLPRRHVL